MIGIINYGLGNVLAFANVYKRFNIPARIASAASELEDAEKLILPGVGSFDHAMELFNASGMRDTVEDMVLNRRVPVLGICVGMQILAGASDEGQGTGLNWIPGRVCRIPARNAPPPARLPHMGWNDVNPVTESPLFAGLETDARFYFLHSYYFSCDHSENVLAEVEHGIKFPCAVHAGNIHGVQFHPEKSHHYGARLLKNFAEH